MALRLSRSFTGKTKFIRFKTHFHGWHDHMTTGYANHFDGTATAGVLDNIASNVILVSPQDISEIKSVIASDDDIAAVIVEPTGSSFGMVPMGEEFLASVREITSANGILLIFDEVVTGFGVPQAAHKKRTELRLISRRWQKFWREVCQGVRSADGRKSWRNWILKKRLKEGVKKFSTRARSMQIQYLQLQVSQH